MTPYRTFATTFAATAALSLSGAAFAQSSPSASSPAVGAAGAASAAGNSRSSLSSADRRFVMEAAKGGMAEVALGQLAQQKGGSDPVKQFGGRMVEDHTKVNDELKQIASAKGIELPAASPKDAKAIRLEKLSGNSFDRAYTSQMHADHKKTIALFQQQSRNGRDPELKAFATKTLPIVQSHLQMLPASGHVDAASAAKMKR